MRKHTAQQETLEQDAMNQWFGQPAHVPTWAEEFDAAMSKLI